MGSGSLVLILCKPSPLAFLAPTLIPSTHLNRLRSAPRSSFRRMASSSAPPAAGGDAIDPHSNNNGTSPSPSPSPSSSSPSPCPSAASAVDFLTLCHRLKVPFSPLESSSSAYIIQLALDEVVGKVLVFI